jgi:hypothetical protein
MLFFTILIIMLAQVMAVIQIGRSKELVKMMKADTASFDYEKYADVTGNEYVRTGLWVGEIFWTLRAAIGDFAVIDASTDLGSFANFCFWFGFLIIVFMSCVIFLNFIVAEASNSYTKVTDTLDHVIRQGQCDLIAEAEVMTWKKYQTP